MRALSLHQPYASLIAHGMKRRHDMGRRGTTYRGPVLVYASDTVSDRERMRWAERRFGGLPLGAVVAVVTLTDSALMTREWVEAWSPAELAMTPPVIANYAVALENPIRLDPPIPAKGRQGLFDVGPEDVGAEAWARIEAARGG